jgi:hypothetical protein
MLPGYILVVVECHGASYIGWLHAYLYVAGSYTMLPIFVIGWGWWHWVYIAGGKLVLSQYLYGGWVVSYRGVHLYMLQVALQCPPCISYRAGQVSVLGMGLYHRMHAATLLASI